MPLARNDGSLSRTLRALAATFVIALASLAGALYLDRAHAGSVGSGIVASDLPALLASAESGDRHLVDNAFQQVERAYYKPVNAQTLLTGERRELVDYLKKHNVSDPAIPAFTATGDEERDLASIDRSLSIAQSKYGAHTSNLELTQAAIRGMLNSLGDPYTTYLSPSEIATLRESLDGGDFGGIGVYIYQIPKSHWVVVDPIEGTPAYRAGIKTGDRILTVDGKAVTPLKLDDVEQLIRGKVGTRVTLSVISLHAKSAHDVDVTRDQIIVPSVHAKIEDGYEYVRLSDFGQTSYDEVRKAMLDGKAHNAKGYILDLRNNGGGLLDAAVNISSMFVPGGTIVSTIDRAGNKETKTATHDPIGATPLVVLVNQYTASASEITAGAIQDDKAGVLIGHKTFGKGVVQSIYNTADGGALKITTARYVTPLGRDIHHKGIDPDIPIDMAVDSGQIIDTPKDIQLAAAKSYLRRVAHR